MIQDLNTAVEAVEQVGGDYTILPKGEYTLELTKVGEWKAKHFKTLIVKPSMEKLEDVDTYSTRLDFKVVAPEDYKGATIIHFITTHPSVPWSISGFLHGMGVESLAPAKIGELVGNTCVAYVKEDSYEKKSVDKDTGEETKEKIPTNTITKFKRLELDLDI